MLITVNSDANNFGPHPPIHEVPRVLFLDANSYYAAVVQTLMPEYQGKPLIVTQVDSLYTTVIAASQEAKKYGIKTGTLVEEAFRLCPDLNMVPAGHTWHEIFREWHFKLYDTVARAVPENEITRYSVDEMAWKPFMPTSIDTFVEFASHIKSRIKMTLGPIITVSIGIAPNTFLAKIASEIQTPDGLVVFSKGYPKALFQLPLTDIPGINHRMNARLNAAGIFTMEQLWQKDPKEMRAAFRSILGERMFHMLRGDDQIDYSPIHNRSKSKGKHLVLPPEDRNYESIQKYYFELLRLTLLSLREKDLTTDKFLISMHLRDNNDYANAKWITREVKGGEFANDDPYWLPLVRRESESFPRPEQFYPYSVGVYAPKIIKVGDAPRSLFTEDRSREIEMHRLVDELRETRDLPIGLASTYFSEGLVPFRLSFGPPERKKSSTRSRPK